MPSSTPRTSMASQDVGQRKLLDDEAAASRDIKQARIGQTVERESDRRAREPLGELLKGSSEIRSPGSISPDEHLSQVNKARPACEATSELGHAFAYRGLSR